MKSPVLGVQMVYNNTVVSLPGYSYAVTYYQPQGSAGLLVKYSEAKNDRRLEMTAAKFLEEAWRLANAKARELGWNLMIAMQSAG